MPTSRSTAWQTTLTTPQEAEPPFIPPVSVGDRRRIVAFRGGPYVVDAADHVQE